MPSPWKIRFARSVVFYEVTNIKVGMVGPKSTQTRMVGITTDKMHCTSYFKQQRFYEKAECIDQGMASFALT